MQKFRSSFDTLTLCASRWRRMAYFRPDARLPGNTAAEIRKRVTCSALLRNGVSKERKSSPRCRKSARKTGEKGRRTAGKPSGSRAAYSSHVSDLYIPRVRSIYPTRGIYMRHARHPLPPAVKSLFRVDAARRRVGKNAFLPTLYHCFWKKSYFLFSGANPMRRKRAGGKKKQAVKCFFTDIA